MKREFDPHEPEQMDRPQPVSPALEEDLRNLVSLNRLFGSHGLIRHFLARWFNPGRTYRILDLATGAGDLPRVMVDWARARDIALRIDAVDANPATLEIAARESRDYREIEFLKGNVLTHESRESYDLVCCSLALHHFSEDDAVTLLRRCRALSHRFVLVSDLERSFFTLAGVHALTTLFYRAPMTRADGVTSARRAFSFEEFRALAEAAGWKDFGHARFLFCRQALWLEGRDAGDIPATVEAVEDGLPSPT
jgi:2-polyprenyl-3-methyl-5-hydroxy-6-metoxy-1,4-benzoquinol methylase